jgi:predicted lactoylglutathione lyase
MSSSAAEAAFAGRENPFNHASSEATHKASAEVMDMPAAISCVTFPVDDLQKSIAFYRDGLGLTVEEQDDEHAAFDIDGVYLVLLDRSEFGTYVEKVGFRPAARGASETIISYFAESRADVDAMMSRAQAAGATLSAASDDDGVYSGYFVDPDGHTWEVLHDQE